jgi:misacylated tRNA(Ala) deacylase
VTELLFREDGYLRSCTARVVGADERGIRLDRTVFYPTGGGQPGDSGELVLADGSAMRVLDTRKGEAPHSVIHLLAPEDLARLAPGMAVTARLDWERRHRHMRMHTALHLLCAAIPAGVTGGQVGDGKGRLDFDIGELAIDKDAVDARLAELVAGDHPVVPRWITDAEMAARPELVRTMSVKPPTGLGRVRLLDIEGVDLQPCGGTHVARTGEIGPLRIEKIENKGKRNRRVSLMFAESP